MIAALLTVGFLFIFASTYFFAYRIPKLDTALLDIDGSITDGEKMLTQMQLMESMSFVPYNIRKVIDILPSPHSYSDVYQQFADEEAKAKRNVLALLYWPDTPPPELLKKWQDMNVNHLESQKLQLLPRFMENLNSFASRRQGELKEKQSLLLWSTVLQMIGLFITQIAVVLQALQK